MKVAMVGLGKLGLPVSLAFASKGHVVYGYEADVTKRQNYQENKPGLYEPDLPNLLMSQRGTGNFVMTEALIDAVAPADIIFIAVPTPSKPDDSFDTSFVKTAVEQVADAINEAATGKYKLVVLISTVLPGTCRTEVLPILESKLGPLGNGYGFCYNAQFIAMGTVVKNALEPEFVLIGAANDVSAAWLSEFYHDVVDYIVTPIQIMTLEDAEIVKCAYNNFISAKIVYANALMELCEKIPNANVDRVVDALSLAKDRLISPKYMRGGLGDGGGCHPRDNRAMSYLAVQLGLSANPFAFVTTSRRFQTFWMSRLVRKAANDHDYPIKILGTTFKPETNLSDDSPALYLAEMLKGVVHVPIETYDPAVGPFSRFDDGPRVYLIGTAWAIIREYPFAPGSIIIDPHGLLKAVPPGCTLQSVGRH